MNGPLTINWITPKLLLITTEQLVSNLLAGNFFFISNIVKNMNITNLIILCCKVYFVQ